MQRIDSHIHFMAAEDEAAWLQAMGVKLMNICIGGLDRTGWREHEAGPYSRLASRAPEQFAWCTSFRSPGPDEPGREYARQVIAGLEQDFAAGAVACKIWKNIGMEDMDRHGRRRMVDDPIFQPILAYLEQTGRTCLMHIGEPYACWQPLTPTSPHYSYYRQHPQWHMHGRTDIPSHGQLMAARDRILARHPRLRVIGAHLGSLEYDLAEIARRLDQFANFAVDTSGRLADLAWQDTGLVRRFLEHYQDRVLWGTDLTLTTNGSTSPLQRNAARDQFLAWYDLEWRYFATTQRVNVAGRECQGLGLPVDILRKLFIDNARRWYPGI